jgi:hypothetical protein
MVAALKLVHSNVSKADDFWNVATSKAFLRTECIENDLQVKVIKHAKKQRDMLKAHIRDGVGDPPLIEPFETPVTLMIPYLEDGFVQCVTIFVGIDTNRVLLSWSNNCCPWQGHAKAGYTMSSNMCNTSLSQPLITTLTLDHGKEDWDGFVQSLRTFVGIVADSILISYSRNCWVLQG